MTTVDEHRPDASDEQDSAVREICYAGYALATFAASVAVFGAGGAVLGMVVLAYWACVFVVPGCWTRVIMMIAISFIGLFMLLPQVDSGPGHQQAVWRMSCANNLKSIALAIHNYHDVYKSFPPAYVLGEDGRRMHSWRVLILPFLEDQQRLYDAYNFAEPWDGTNNRELILQMPKVFCCPSQCRRGDELNGFTNYFAIVGDRTTWPGSEAISVQGIADGTSNTLLLCEAEGQQIPWTKPVDLDDAAAIELLTSHDWNRLPAHSHRTFFHEWFGGRHIAFADAHIHCLPGGIREVDANKLITRDDGVFLDSEAVQANAKQTERVRTGNCIRLGIFVLLAVWPLPWVWINPHGPRTVLHADEKLAADEP